MTTSNTTAPVFSVRNTPGYQGLYIPGAQGLGASPSIQVKRTTAYAVQDNVAASDMMALLADPSNRDAFLVSVVTFDDTAKVISRHAKAADLVGKVAVTGHGGTDVAAALREINQMRASRVFQANQFALAAPGGVLMSDGCTSDPDAARREADLAKRDGVTVFTVAFGGDADLGLLQQLASHAGLCQQAFNGDEFKRILAVVGQTLRDSQRTGQHPAAALAQAFNQP